MGGSEESLEEGRVRARRWNLGPLNHRDPRKEEGWKEEGGRVEGR